MEGLLGGVLAGVETPPSEAAAAAAVDRRVFIVECFLRAQKSERFMQRNILLLSSSSHENDVFETTFPQNPCQPTTASERDASSKVLQCGRKRATV